MNDNPVWAAPVGAALVLAILIGLALAIYPGWPAIGLWMHQTDAPAWVQAIGSILAILGSAVIVWVQHELEKLRKTASDLERRKRKLAVIVEIARATASATNKLASMFANAKTVYDIASGDKYFDKNIILTLDNPLLAIQLHELDDPKVANEILIFTGNVRQFKENLLQLLQHYRHIDIAQFTSATAALDQCSANCQKGHLALKAELNTLAA